MQIYKLHYVSFQINFQVVFWYFIVLSVILLYLLILAWLHTPNDNQHPLHDSSLWTIPLSAIVHCLHLLVLPPAICCSSNIAKKATKRKLLKSSISKSLLSSGFKHILLSVRIVSLYQSNGLYFSSPSMRQDMAMLLRISVILVCCIFGIVSNSQINRISTAQ